MFYVVLPDNVEQQRLLLISIYSSAPTSIQDDGFLAHEESPHGFSYDPR